MYYVANPTEIGRQCIAYSVTMVFLAIEKRPGKLASLLNYLPQVLW